MWCNAFVHARAAAQLSQLRFLAVLAVLLLAACGDDGGNSGSSSDEDQEGNGDAAVDDTTSDDAMTNDAGMTGTGDTTAGDATTPDADTTMVDSCEGVANACDSAGASCDGDNLVTCAEDANGCLVATTTDCTVGDTDRCESGACVADADPCAGLTLCTTVGASCSGHDLVTCAEDANGCLVETTTDCTSGGTNVCEAGACAVDPCAGLSNSCDTAGVACDGNDLVTCAENGDGCLVETVTDCSAEADKNSCGDDGGAACINDPCKDADGVDKDDVCVEDVLSCQGDILVDCVDDADGCPIAVRKDCTTEVDKNFCNPEGGAGMDTPMCDLDPCIGVTQCLTAGRTCDGTNVVECASDDAGCLVTTITDCTEGGTAGNTCGADAGGDGVAGCTSCTDAEGCSTEETRCNGNVFETCADVDSDGCLDLTVEDCGDNFTCDMTNGCEYSGGDSCDEALENVLSAPMTTAPVDVGVASSEYTDYLCPESLFGIAFAADGGDVLFAIDVPAGQVATVSVESSTVTGEGAFLLRLDACADDAVPAEETCAQFSDGAVDYTNTGDTTARFYVVIDTISGDTGTVALRLEMRDLDCGDGKLDGDEECDDGNIFEGDGCTPTCTLEESYVCTANDPSVCTRRPDDGVCGNVQCDPVAAGAPSGTAICCTPDELCGVGLDGFWGSACFEANQEGVADASCDTETPTAQFLGFPSTLQGCCRQDNRCGVLSSTGAGCIERTEAWLGLADGDSALWYEGPFEAQDCTYVEP
ncbi:MAG: hypothetical protein OEZ06_08115 [Myxococcales bacterium]|nr:hypothetical protein [Myxococcales bacterium]